MRVAYVGTFIAGHESAGIQRVAGIAQSLSLAGHSVVVGGQGAGCVHLAPDITFEGFAHAENLRLRTARTRRTYGVEAWLTELSPSPDIVIVYGGAGPFVDAVARWARSRGIRRVVDSVEWYDRHHIQGGAWGIKALDNELSMRWRYPRHDGAIAISSMLEQHYCKSCRDVVRIPPTLDVRSAGLGRKPVAGPLVLRYAGSPGLKDLLGEIVTAVSRVDSTGRHLRLEVVGTTALVARELPGMPSSIPESVSFTGRVPRSRVLELMGSADYVPLLRPNERYANAGFPTKVVEAMAVGTPLIGNLTSDLGDYVHDGETGLVSESADAAGFAAALERAIVGGRQLAGKLSLAAREEALDSFDFRVYTETLSGFVETVRG